MIKRLTLFIVTAGLLSVSPRATARGLENWTYERLFKEADLVVLASALKTEAAEGQAPLARPVAVRTGRAEHHAQGASRLEGKVGREAAESPALQVRETQGGSQRRRGDY